MREVTHPQGSPEWLAARVGLVTASRISDVIAKTKSGAVSASRAGYLAELVAERLTGVSAASDYINGDMQRGIDLEPAARFEYEIRTGQVVRTCGLILHPDERCAAGASPDGLVGDDGCLEIKCPKTHVHIGYIEAGKPPAQYVPQMAWQCICAGRPWCDFASFDPKMPERLRLFVVRYTPDFDYLRELQAEVDTFLAEVAAKVERLKAL